MVWGPLKRIFHIYGVALLRLPIIWWPSKKNWSGLSCSPLYKVVLYTEVAGTQIERNWMRMRIIYSCVMAFHRISMTTWKRFGCKFLSSALLLGLFCQKGSQSIPWKFCFWSFYSREIIRAVFSMTLLNVMWRGELWSHLEKPIAANFLYRHRTQFNIYALDKLVMYIFFTTTANKYLTQEKY